MLPSRSFDPAELWSTVEREKVNAVVIVGDAFAKPLLAELDANPGKYDLSNAGKHYGLCHTPVNGKARMTNLLLTMMHKMEVNTEQFVDSLGPVSEVM